MTCDHKFIGSNHCLKCGWQVPRNVRPVNPESLLAVPDAGPRLYASRKPWDLEPYYSRHVAAMTTEGLHGKADIAEELAWRDKEIARLRAALDVCGDTMGDLRRAALELGEHADAAMFASAERAVDAALKGPTT